MTQLSGFRSTILFLKATQKKLIYIPPYTKADGTVVPGHQAYVHVADDHADHKVVSGQGTYTQKQAHAKHAHEPWFQALPEDHKAPVLMHIATGLQDAASAAAVVSTFKKKILAGVKPTPGEWKAYAAAPEAKKAEIKAAADAAGQAGLLASNPEAVAPAAAAPAPAATPAAKPAEVHVSSHQATPAAPAAAPLSAMDKQLVDSMVAKDDAEMLQSLIDKSKKPATVAYAKEALAKLAPAAETDPLKAWPAFAAAHGEDITEFEDIKPFLKNPATAGLAALKGFISGSFTELNTKPDSPEAKALLATVAKLPSVDMPAIHRVVAFENDAERTAFLASLDKPQERTLSSWTSKDPAAPGQTPMNNIGLDLAAQFGEKRVFMTVVKPSTAKDISFAYSGGAKPGLEQVLAHGTQFIVDSVTNKNGDVHVAMREAQEGDTKPGANGGTLVLKDGHWIKQGGDAPAAAPGGDKLALLAKISGAKLPSENVNAAAFNPKVQAIADAFKAGDVTKLLHMGFGSNTYQKKAVGLVNEALAALGSSHKVAVSQKMGSHAALNGGTAAPSSPTVDAVKEAPPKVVAAAVKPAPAAKPAAPAALWDAEIPKPSDGVSSEYAPQLHALAKQGDVAGMEALVQELHAKSYFHTASYGMDLLGKMKAKQHAPAPTSAAPGALLPSELPHKPLGIAENYADQVDTLAKVGDIAGLQKLVANIPKDYGMTKDYAKAVLATVSAKAHGLNDIADDDTDAFVGKPVLAGKPAYDHIAHGNMETAAGGVKAAHDWLAANPDGKAELKEALSDHGLYHVALQMGLGDDAPAAPEPAKPAAAPAAAAPAPAATKAVKVKADHYENTEDGHNKFWNVGVHGNQMITHYGAIGSKGSKTVKTFPSEAAAKVEMHKLIKQKTAKDYEWHGATTIDHDAPVAGAAPAAAPAAPKVTSVNPAAVKPSAPADLGVISNLKKIHLIKVQHAINEGDVVALEKLVSDAHEDAKDETNGKWAKIAAYTQQALDYVKGQGAGVTSMKMGPSVDAGPKEGDTKQGVDGMLVLKNGHWVKVAPTISASDLPAAPMLNMAVNKAMAEHAKKLALAGDLQGLKILQNNGTNVAKLKAYYGALIAALEKKGVTVGMAAATQAAPKRSPKVTGAKAKPTPTTAVSGEPVSMAGWTKTAGQKGYNEGGFFKDPAGQDWYCKFPAGGDAVVKNELLANKLAQLAGLSVPDLQLVNQGGKVGLASKIIPGAKENKAALLDGKASGLLSSFAVHAWLANWDAVGNNPSKGFDNILVDDKGVAHHIDQGGALNYGGAGGKKQQFSDKVIELKTMLDPNKNANTSAVFGKMGAADITASVAKVAAISDDEITDFCLKYGPGSLADRQKMAATLIARKADMIAQYPGAAKAPKAAKPKAADHSWVKLKPGEKVVEVGTKFGGSFAKIEVPAKGFNADGIPKPFTYDKSSSAFVNAANTADIKKVYDTALSSKDAETVKGVKFEQIVKGTGEKTGKMISIDDHPSTAYVKEYVNQVAAELEAQTKPTYRMEHRGGFTSSYSAAAAEIAGAVKALDHTKFQGWKDKAADYLVLNKTAGAGIPAPDLGQFKDVEPSDKEIVAFKAASDAKYAQLSAGEKSACKAYTGSAYWNWNSAMRLGTVDSADFKAGAPMRQAFSKAAVELPEGIVLHRGIGVGGDTYKSVIGAVIQDGSFQSCSYGKKAAFSGHQSQLRLHISKGVKGMMATTFSGFGSSEREIILHPNCRYVVMSVESQGGKNIVNILVLPHEG